MVLAVVVLAYLGRPTGDGQPLHPRNAGPSGAYGLVELLAELGADVDREAADAEGADVALVLVDQLSEAARDGLDEWVRDGGTLVVTDPRSPLVPDPVGPISGQFLTPPIDAPACDIAALADVGEVRPASSAVAFDASADGVGCYPTEEGTWLVVEPRGDGTLVALGGPDVWTNAQIGTADHAALAAALLIPAEDTAVALLRPTLPGDEGATATLSELIPDRVIWGLAQLALALAAVAVWRARRLGQPVAESQPVAIPGSELVVAAANLAQRAALDAPAAQTICDDAIAHAGRRLGLGPDAEASEVAAAAVSRGLDHRVVGAVTFAGDDPVAAAAAADALRTALRSIDEIPPDPARTTTAGGAS